MRCWQLSLPFDYLDEVSESSRLAFVRLGLGLLIFYRGILDLILGIQAGGEIEWIWSVPVALGGLLLIVGLLTRYTYALFAIFYLSYNIKYEFMNLGPLFMQPLFWFGLILDSRPVFSIDSLLAKRDKNLGKVLLWRASGTESSAFVYARFLLFFIYAVNSGIALGYHLGDEFWRNGRTVHAILVNSYLSQHFEMLRSIEASVPELLKLFSWVSIVLQTIFQFLMLPLVFTRFGRLFVIVHGYLFFVFSLFFLQISVLPVVELLYWYLIFGFKPKIGQTRVSEIVRLTPARMFVGLPLILAALVGLLIQASEIWPRYFPRLPSSLEQTAKLMAIWPPNVFNKPDLGMGEVWFVIERIPSSGERETVQYFSENGKRLREHNYDRIYYGHTLQWRRLAAEMSDSEILEDEMVNRILRKLCAIDYRRHKTTEKIEYEITIYRDTSMQLELPIDVRYKARVLGTKRVSLPD